MKRDLLPLVTVDGRHAGELLAHPCPCGRPRCTLGEHIWESTRNMAPGPRAANTDPRGRSWPTDDDRPDPVDTTDLLHDRYKALLDQFHGAARNLIRFIDAHRPDRWIELPDPASDRDACRNHLDGIGTWEPRSRGDLCEFCASYAHATNRLPNRVILRVRHEGRHHEVDRLIADDAAEAARKKKTAKRRRKVK